MALTETHLALVMEYAPGGSLTTYVSKRYETNEDNFGRAKDLYLDEDEALYFFRQFISAVEFCHRHKVMHRDLKLDNTLLDGERCQCPAPVDLGREAPAPRRLGRPISAALSTATLPIPAAQAGTLP